MKRIYTVGHSTHPLEYFIKELKSFNVEALIDVRSLPGSRKFPQFNKEALEITLPEQQIEYFYLKDLGGRRRVLKDSPNTAWNNPSFRGYADYMLTSDFLKGINELEHIALLKTSALFCAEVLWWKCHRSMIADYLKSIGWEVIHINAVGKSSVHPYTSAACIVNGELSYKK